MYKIGIPKEKVRKEAILTSPKAELSTLSKIERLVASEKYRKALGEVKLLRTKKMGRGHQLRIGVLESRCWMGLGEVRKAFKTAQSVVEEGAKLQEHKTHVIHGLLEMASASWGLGNPDMILESCRQAEQLWTELQTDDMSLLDSIRADILFHKSPGLYLKDDVHGAIKCVKESVAINERLGSLPGVVAGVMRLAYLHIEVDTSLTLEYQERGFRLNEQLGHPGHVIFGLCCIALVQIFRQNWDEAEGLIQQSLDVAKEHDHGRWMPFILYNSAALYYGNGDFGRTEEAYKEYIRWGERIGGEHHVALGSNNLGEVYRARGDFDNALRCYERTMEFNKRTGRTKGYLVGLANCGLVQYARGFPNEALRLLEESLILAEEQDQAGLLGGFIITYNILYIASILVDKGMVDEAQQRVEHIRKIKERTKNPFDEHVYRIAAALVLKSSTLPRNRVMAKEHLAEVVDGSFWDYETNTLALLHLTELLVNELQITGDAEVIESLNVRLRELLDLAADQKSTLLLIEVKLLQSKAALLQLEADKANRLLNEARSLAEQKGLENLSERIVEEQNILLNELTIWEKLGEEQPPMVERTEKVRLHKQITTMIQQSVWRKMLF
ncbi:MAG: tetratricopeptide repeat protein [Promethearchaeota archaeon]